MAERQKEFYERFYLNLKKNGVEKMKQDARLRAIRELINANGQINKETLIVGCGCGDDTGIFQEKVIAFDLSFTAVKTSKQNFPQNIYLSADAGNIPFKDNIFERVVCSEVIEHVSCPQKVLAEFYRLLRRNGELIITAPNWLSFYGIARKLAEFIMRKPVTASGQPIDNWYTLKSLEKKLAQRFIVAERRGVWYYPPAGKGNFVIPDTVVLPIFRAFEPIDHCLGKRFPAIGGHIIALRAVKNIL